MSNNTQDMTRLISVVMQLGLQGGKPQAFMLTGDSGTGKTEGIPAIARELSRRLDRPFPSEIWSGPQLQAEDAGGLPVPDLETGTTRLLPLRIGSSLLAQGAGVLCIDEFGSLSSEKEAAFLNLVQGSRLGEQVLPSTISLGAMMNPIGHASNARQLSAPAANRFVWIKWELDNSLWIDYMRGGKGIGANVVVLPENWESKYFSRASSLVTAYISRNPSALHRMPQARHAGQAWASPRSWHTFTRLLAALTAAGERQTSDLVALALEGCVGQGEAESFMGWVVNMDLPDPEELLADPSKASTLLPKRNSMQVSVCLESVAVAATSPHDDFAKRWLAAWDVVGPVLIEKHDTGLPAAMLLARALGDNNELQGVQLPSKYTKHIHPILTSAGLVDR